jgi:hypothetical protein
MRLRVSLALIIVVCFVAPALAQKRNITEKDLWDFVWIGDPQVSPDGSRVAFVRVTVNEKKDRYDTELWVMPATPGATARRLTNGPSDSTPRWSRDGKRIAFTTGDCEIETMAPDGSALTHLGPIGPPCHADQLYTPVWSPDGTQIAILTGPDIELIDVATERHRTIPLAGHPNVFGIAWRPAAPDVPPPTSDEQALAPVLRPGETLRQGHGGSLLAVSASGRERVLATCAVACGQPTVSPTGDGSRTRSSGASPARATRPPACG